MPYNHQQIEKKWQQKWADSQVFKTKENSEKPKFYALDMFPYPSGAGLHVGHPKGYIATDVMARMKMMQGYSVLHPMGWDAFGLPAENYAIKNKVHPAVATAANIEVFKKQLSILGFTYDWNREVNTTDPKYYKWTQWAFLQMFKKGLAFESNEPVNWCPSCKTVLANEDLEDGKCERCGTVVEQKPIRQWVLKITKYADRLLADLDKLTEWPESIKQMQREWIGRSEGAEVSFHLSPNPSPKGRGDFGYVTTNKEKWSLLHDKSLEMRKNSTKAEDVMWQILRRDATGFHFRRQQIIGGFIVDFVCLSKKLVVEVDGDIHDYQKEEDENRTNYLNELGFEVIRFKNDEVLLKADQVVVSILKKIKEISSNLKTLPFGEGPGEVIKVFTTRPDTLFGATYMVLAPEHPLVSQITTDEQKKEVENYITASKNKTAIERGDDTKEKTGVFTGAYAINPVNEEKIPVWVADYVLWGYGTGAIMAVPAHDERDFAFAKKYNLPIKQVVAPHFVDPANPTREGIPESRRKNVHVIIRNPKDGKVLLLNWFSNLTASRPHLHTFIIGGIEGDEDLATAALREAQEETGYKHFKFIKDVGFEIHTEYFAEHKGQNRYAEIRVAVLDLIDEERDEIPESELKNHEPVWFDESEVEKTVNVIDGPMIWNAYKNGMPVFAEEGVAINSGFVSGFPTWKAKDDIISWLEEKGLGARKVQYKLRDWVFSRQRYWGEPIPLVHCEVCKEQIEKTATRINFRRQDTWAQLISGRKTVETRALNPEEPEKYFGNVGVGQYLCAVNKNTGEEKYFKVTKVWQFKNLDELFGYPALLGPIDPDDNAPTLEDWKIGYGKSSPDYLNRIEKNGLIAWQIEMVTPGVVPLPEDQLPLELPEVENYEPSGTGESPLATIEEWVNTKCPVCDGPAKRETNTMPQWAGSCWYYLRYCDPKNDQDFFGCGLVQRPAVSVSEKDKQYFSEFKKLYSELETKGIKIWAGNRLMLNGLNRELWLPLRTISVMVWEKDITTAADYLVSNDYRQTQNFAGNLMFEKNDIRTELIPVYQKDNEIFSLSYGNAKQVMKITDFPESLLGNLWGFAYRVVSPSYNLAHYKFVQENEKESREGLGDDEKISFLEEWLQKNNQKLAYWNPVDLYVGGAEHATRHLIYARFWHKFLFDIGAVNVDEPFARLQNVGLILAEDGRKMSKRWGNVINPDDMVSEYGADALRVYEMFMGPFNQPTAWSTNGLVGARRFLEKVSGLIGLVSDSESPEVTRALHQTIKKVSEDIADFRQNTAVAQMMTFVNKVLENKTITKESFVAFLKVLCPFAPHLTNELAEQLGEVGFLEEKSWPTFDPTLLVSDTVEIAVQVNGKLRASITVPSEVTEDEAKTVAAAEENVKKYLEGKEIVKVIFVKGKLINIVVK